MSMEVVVEVGVGGDFRHFGVDCSMWANMALSFGKANR